MNPLDPRDPVEGPELRKPHEMIVMIPRSKRVTLTGRRLYNALLQVAQARLAAMDAMPQADFMFEAPLPALLRTTGSSGEDRTAAKRYLREMRGLEVDWESTAPGDGVKWRGFSMLSEVAIEVRNGENWVSWSYPPSIMTVLREPQRWASIDLDVLARLGTYTAVALYEICARYRDNPSGLTSRKPAAWWSDALNQAPGGADRREWRKFKSERVRPAIDEINRETDLEVELIEHKQGRAVVEVQFAVRRRLAPPRTVTGLPEPADANLVLRAESLGIREIKLEGLLIEFGDERVRQQLEMLERRAANNRLSPLDNAYSYLRTLLRTETVVASGAGPAAQPVAVLSSPAPVMLPQGGDRVRTVVERERPPSPASAGGATVGRTEFDPEAQARWLNARIAEVRQELVMLTPEERKVWVDRAIQELSAKGSLSAVIVRRAAQGDVLHGLLGSVVVRLYASATHGEDWNQPPASLS
jgi:hypothetical protein